MSNIDHEMWLHMPQTAKVLDNLKAIQQKAEFELLNNAELYYSEVRFPVFAEYQVAVQLLKLFESEAEAPTPAEEKPADPLDSQWNSLIDNLDVD